MNDRGWLHQKYVTEGLDCTQIARIVGRDSKTVWSWLKAHGIPTRPRGSDPRHRPRGRAAGFKHTQGTREKIRAACIRDGRVPYLKGGRHWLHAVGREHHPRWKGGITPERQALYASREWKAAARAAKKRDGHACRRCGLMKKRGDGAPFDLHHVVPFECVALRAAVDNLVYLCEPCHMWVHGPENVEKRFILPCQ
jgi:5-methylcytosine-specific restriction endonuclease McrA